MGSISLVLPLVKQSERRYASVSVQPFRIALGLFRGIVTEQKWLVADAW